MTTPADVRLGRHDEAHFIKADDGVPLTLVRVVGAEPSHRGPVMLVHGVAMRAEMFRPPVNHTLVQALLDDGWDVWMLNWRGSLDLDPLPWTVDDVAGCDLPAAVRHVADATGARNVKVIAHCVGAMAASWASVAGLIPQVDTIVASGVSLHPVVPRMARIKLHTLRPLLQSHEPYVDAAWGDGPERLVPTITRTAVRWGHPECSNPTCNMASFALGAGRPAPWLHENLNVATHDWLTHEFGKVPMSFYHQLAISERAGELVGLGMRDDLPRRLADLPPRPPRARFALFTGQHNRSFLAQSQRLTHAWLLAHPREQGARPDTLNVVRGYSHTDLFVGRYAWNDTFPRMVAELRH
ncbi:esterase/lipase family protein [Aestuariimicrobium soli]|uniref:esterase/lipase family protein n=1 Tax=Aestuariimicrobium soli TaxID=2035834 RepID=UPI003EBC8476